MLSNTRVWLAAGVTDMRRGFNPPPIADIGLVISHCSAAPARFSKFMGSLRALQGKAPLCCVASKLSVVFSCSE